MSDRIKKILKIITVILVIVLIGLVIYSLFFKKDRPITPSTPEEEVFFGEEFTPQAKERLVAITEEAVLGAGLSTDKITYVSWDGTVNKIDFNGGSQEKLGSLPDERTGEVKISPDGTYFAAEQVLASGQKRHLLFDTVKRTMRSLPQNTQALTFDFKGDAVAALAETGSSRIVSIDPETQKQTLVASTKIPDLVLDRAGESSLALKTRPSGLAYGLLYTLDAKSKKTNRVLGNVYGLTSLFSPSGKKILYGQTSASGRDLELKVLNLDKKTEVNLNIFSLPEKCVWGQDNRTLWCGVINTETSPVMPDDYYKGKIESSGEDIVRINLDTGQTQKLIGGFMDVARPFLAPDESYLFFVNKKDGRLYRLTL